MWNTRREKIHILIIQTDLKISGLNFCVQMVWVVIVTGRLNGVGLFLYQWVTEALQGKKTMKNLHLDGMISPGVWSVLIVMVTLSGTITIRHTSHLHPPMLYYPSWPPPSLYLKKSECMWTVMLVSCPSTECYLENWSTFTPSTLHSRKLYPGFTVWPGSSVCLCWEQKISTFLHFSNHLQNYMSISQNI